MNKVTGRSATVVAVLLTSLTCGATSASAGERAGERADDPPESTAVVTPMLGVFQYGAGSGLPLMCHVSGGLVLSGSDQLAGGGQAIGPAVSQLNDSCALMSTSGKDFFGQAIEGSRALAPVNPVVNPALAAAGDTVVRTGTDDAEILAPFGPTVAGLGGLLRFLQGT